MAYTASIVHDMLKCSSVMGAAGGIPMNSVTTYAPGRAELLGNHTDYNEGYVLAIAVDRGTTLKGQTRGDRHVHIHSHQFGKTEIVELDQLASERVTPWARYPFGVIDQFLRNDLPVEGFEAEISSNLPIGAGLSSSASLENATVLFLARLLAVKPARRMLARSSQKSDPDLFGARSGLFAQTAAFSSKPRR